MSQTPEGSAPPAHSPRTVLGAAQAVLSYVGQGSPSESPRPTVNLDTAAHDVMSRVDKASESSTSALVGAAQNLMSRVDKASESTTSAVVGASQNVMSRIDKASESSASTFMGAAQSLFSRAEKPSEASASAAVMGAAAQNVFTRIASPSAHHQASSNLASDPLPELPQEHSAEALAPADAPQQHAAEPGALAPTFISPQGGAQAGRREITPPLGASRRDSRLHRSYPILPDATHQRPLPVSYRTATRRSAGPYPDIYDSEAAWHVAEDRDLDRPKTVRGRLADTVKSAKDEHTQADAIAKRTGTMLNVALILQVLIGALTTALGAALTGKNTSVAISILGGASTLIASYLARMKGTNEPQMSQHRAQQLDHFIREIEGFIVDYGHERGTKWDDKIRGFRLGLEKILGNQPGSVTINSDGTFNPNQEKGVGATGPDTSLNSNGNGPYGMSTIKGKTGGFDG